MMQENRLLFEKSPYLLQHAHNPVDWHPWGEDAFLRASEEEKPVFLSIGYSTCHWCHVMEKESFEDEEVAALLNRYYVAVKVDREERPDVDAVYMAACLAASGSGGWPLTILMTPKGEPFYAGTYLPKHSRYGGVGLVELLTGAAKLWKGDRTRLLQAGAELSALVAGGTEAAAKAPERELLDQAVLSFQQIFDPVNGGFGPAPKFPAPHNLLFLLRYARLERRKPIQDMVETTLTQMARGGIFDQLGGGFSRYSTDERWLVPHFEKMLYDNALLAYTYLEACLFTDQPFFQTVAERTLSYLLRELSGPEGGFCCAQDADSDGEEGSYYLFTQSEIEQALDGPGAKRFCSWFDVTGQGSFEGKNVLNLLKNPHYASPYSELTEQCARLLKVRENRKKLHRDDKILTSWNALTMAAMAKAFRVLGKEIYLETAKQIHAFLKANLATEEGRLFLRWREGEAAVPGQLEDYAYYAWALLELYAANFEVTFLQEAAALAEWMERLFSDREKGGYFLYAADAEQLIARPKELYDGAVPSGNSVAGLVLIRLAQLTGDALWQKRAERQLSFLGGNCGDAPTGHSFSLIALSEALYPAGTLVCCLPDGRLPKELRHCCEERKLAVLVKTEENASALAEIAGFTRAYPSGRGEAYYYCEAGACRAPAFSLKELWRIL